MRSATLLLTLILTLPLLLCGEANAVEKTNRVQFGKIKTGASLGTFMTFNKNYTKSEPTSFAETIKEVSPEGMWNPLPNQMSTSGTILNHLSTIEVTSSETGCGMIPRLIFLTGPEKSTAELYAYEFTICDDSKLLNTETVLDQYIAKYGMYDAKDYDRNMIIYNEVKNRYRVGVTPLEGKNEKAGLTITIVDSEIFKLKYREWRLELKKARKTVQKLF